MDEPLVRGVLTILAATALFVALALALVQVLPLPPRVKSVLRLGIGVGALLGLMRLLGAF